MNKYWRWFRILCMPLALFISVLACDLPWETTDLSVSCDTADLIDAINTANASNDAYTLHLAADCTYVLTSVDNQTVGSGGNGLPAITGSIEINGHNATISRDLDASTPEFRFFFITEDGWLSLKRLTLTHGRGQSGGAIYVDGGYLFIYSSSFIDNDALFQGHGGAIFNDGKMEIVRDTWFENNRAMVGGAIATGLMLDESQSIEDCTFVENNGSWGGGAVYRNGGTGEVILKGSTFQGNSSNRGGAVYIGDKLLILTIENSEFIENGGGTTCGAVLSEDGAINVDKSYFEGNEAFNGGALCSWGGDLSVTYSTFFQNTAPTKGGAISGGGELHLVDSTFSENSTGGDGGGLCSWGHLIVENSTFDGNVAEGEGGGIHHSPGILDSPVEITNSTISNNQATRGGGALIGSPATITHSTIVLNEAQEGAGIYHEAHVLEISNTIVALNAVEDCKIIPSVFSALGQNINSDGSCPGFITADPVLAPLADNGGSTQTHALLIGSPAVDAILGTCIPTDQRGQNRPDGSACDIGAYEGVSELSAANQIQAEAFFPEEPSERRLCPFSRMPMILDASCLEASLSQEQLQVPLPMYVRGIACSEGEVSLVTIDPGFKSHEALVLTPEILSDQRGQFEVKVNDELNHCDTNEDYPGRLFCTGPPPPQNTLIEVGICWQGDDARFLCPPGFVYVQETESCIPLSEVGDCPITCPPGYEFDPSSGRCIVLTGERVEGSADVVGADECPEGFSWNGLAECCAAQEKPEGVECPKGTFYDHEEGFCLPLPEDGGCPRGYELDTESGECRSDSRLGEIICMTVEESVPICPQECPIGEVWSSKTNQCEPVLVCRKELNQEDCEASGGTWRTPMTTAPYCECP
jgi:predicted outer membrane repeat protein